MNHSFLLLFFFALNVRAEVLLHKSSNAPAKKINIEKLNGLHVNIECIQNKKECLTFITNSKKTDPASISQTKQFQHVLGNPASNFCETNKGSSEILSDLKNNEYDYCVFENKYFVDSWDFYRLNKH